MTLKLCIAQLDFLVGDTAGNAQKIIAASRAAYAQGARVVQGSAENARRFHNPELADAAGAAAYVAREWAEDRIRARHDWLFDYRADEVPV